MSDSDSDTPVVKRVKKPIVDDSSDDDAPVVKKAPKKAAVDSDDDDDVPVAKKPTKKAAVEDDDDDDDDLPVVKKAGAVEDDSDDDDVAVRAQHIDPMATLVTVDYDAMDEAQFEKHLQEVSKRQRMQDMQRAREAKKAKEAADAQEPVEAHFDGSSSYTYKTMLHRILAECHSNNPELTQEARIKLPAPKIERSGSKKTALTNFKAICTTLGRTMEEMKDFIEKSLTTQSSIDNNNCLIIRVQNVKQPQMEKLLDQYVEQYVRCNSCGKIKTDLTRDSSSRLQVLTCRNCKASRYIQAVGSATYQAQTVRRARQRARQL